MKKENMKGKIIIATAIVIAFLVSAIPAVNADTAPTSYKATYPAEWIDSDVQEITTGAVPVGEAKLGFANTMTASDDEDGTGEEYQTGIRGDLRDNEPDYTGKDGSHIYYNGEKFYFHGPSLGDENVAFDTGVLIGYYGWIWRENPSCSNGYEEYQFRTYFPEYAFDYQVNIDQETSTLNEILPKLPWKEEPQEVPPLSGLLDPDEVFITHEYSDGYVPPYEEIGNTPCYRLFSEITFEINTDEADIEDNPGGGIIYWLMGVSETDLDPGTWHTYQFYASGNWAIDRFAIHAYPISETQFVSSDLYDFTWLPPVTKENLNAGRTIPVKFTVTKPGTTDFLHDENIYVEVLDNTGAQVFSAVYGEGNTNVRIDDADEHYVVNWKTEKNYTGDYTILVVFSNGFMTAGAVTL